MADVGKMTWENIVEVPSGGEAELLKFAEEIGGRIRVIDNSFENMGPEGQCYWNVERAIARNGGSAVFGWDVIWWKHKWIHAIHHCVWNNSDSILDVTSKSSFRGNSKSVFIQTNQSVEFNNGARVPKLIKLLEINKDASNWREADLRVDNARHRKTAEVYSGNAEQVEKWENFYRLYWPWWVRSEELMIRSYSRDEENCICLSGKKFSQCHKNLPLGPNIPGMPPVNFAKNLLNPDEFTDQYNYQKYVKPTQNRNELCACGSGKKYKKCHGQFL